MGRQKTVKWAGMLGALLGTVWIASCGVSRLQIQARSPAKLQDSNVELSQSTFLGGESFVAADAAAPQDETLTIAPNRPQLIRRASIDLVVDSVDDALAAISELVGQFDGDLLSLNESTPNFEGDRHAASLQLRVPQARLDEALAQLGQLGTLQSQSISAEDVSTQIVDYDARLRNLRQGEAAVLALFERSGRLSDVLEVTRELGTIRQQIEQTEARLTYLQNQVAYSQISINLETELAAVPRERSLATQLQEAWQQSTHSLGVLTVSLLEGGIWLVVYSPYWIAIGSGAAVSFVFLRRKWRGRQQPAIEG